MSGHSKWSKIKHKKALTDAKKGKVFSKLAQQITIAAREGGDPESNFSLRLLIDKAKSASMPADNIQRAVDRGAGKGSEVIHLEKVTYEGIGPLGVSVIVETLTDNKNRTVADLRKTFSERGGALAEAGAVMWNFDQLGLVTLKAGSMKKSEKYGHSDEFVPSDPEEVTLALMEIQGITDIDNYHDDEENVEYLDVYTDPKSLTTVRDTIKDMGYVITSAELIWRAKVQKELDEQEVERIREFVEAVEEHDDIQSVWTDIDDQL